MLDVFNRFSLDATKFNWVAVACICIIWLTVVVCALTSVNAQPMGKRMRLFWIVFITGVPLIGVLSYLPFSFRLESYPSLSLLKKSK